MFTGIITDIGTVRSVEQRGDLRLVIAAPLDLASVALGASIACSGTCLTVVDKGDDWFAVDVSAETMSKTASAHWRQGARLNLERALRLGDELGGHLVTGHVDGVGEVLAVAPDGDSRQVTLRAPAALGRFLAAKGSVTLDGVSLTVNAVRDTADACEFTVNIIPHTADHTTLGDLAPSKEINLEIDVIARYLDRMNVTKSAG
jgi:riboflavin synthase